MDACRGLRISERKYASVRKDRGDPALRILPKERGKTANWEEIAAGSVAPASFTPPAMTGSRVDRDSLIEATDADLVVIISLNVEHDLAALR